MNRRRFLAALPAAAAPLAAGRAVARDELPEITFDPARDIGSVRPLHGVNGGPLEASSRLDLSARWKEAGFPIARLHDCHWPNPDVVDVHAVFPNPAADPADPANYDFGRTDEYVKAVVGTGARVVFRLGESIEHAKVKRYVRPPADPARWAAVCVGVARHYTQGWAGGFEFPVSHWEIWNEPDNRPAMWTGTDDDYFRLYAVAARTLKARLPKLLVGGPGLGNVGDLTGDRLVPPPFVTAFLDRCRRDALPLDFFSWHCYTADPGELVRRAVGVRRLLDAAGFKATESHLNEWAYLPGGRWDGVFDPDPAARRRWHEAVAGPHGAAFAAAALAVLQDAPLDVANFFTAEPGTMGLFDHHGGPRKAFHAFRAFRAVAACPRWLAVAGGVPAGVAATGGHDPATGAAVVMLARHDGMSGTLGLRFGGPAKPARYEVLVVDADRDLSRVTGGQVERPSRVVIDLGSPAVALVRVTPVTSER